jgi:hypothetical protein
MLIPDQLAELYSSMDDSLRAVMPLSGTTPQPLSGRRPEPPHRPGTSVDLCDVDEPTIYPVASDRQVITKIAEPVASQVITRCERGHVRNRWTTYYYRGRAHCRLCRNLRRRERYRLTHTKWRTARELAG